MKSHERTMRNLTMQRRHFQLISDVLREEKPAREGTSWSDGARDEWGTIVLRFAGVLASTNPGFDRERFLAACKGED